MKSIRRMAFLVTSPISIIIPIMENRFMVELNRNNARKTPISDKGRDAMMAAG